MQSSHAVRSRFPRRIARQLADLARATPEREICGLIGAAADGTLTLYPVPNRAVQPAIRFDMDPRAQISAFRCMRESGETLLAIYHSHPTTAAVPSATDIAEAAYPDALYLILSLAEPTPDLRAYILREGTVSVVELEMV